MNKTKKIIRNAALGLTALIAIVVIAALSIVQTGWFRDWVRQKIVSATEEGTGGRASINSLTFDLSHMLAVVNSFVIHGNEPDGSEPLVSVARVELRLRLFTSLRHLVEISYLGIDQPQVNIVIFPDGRTNVPTPKQRSASNKSPLQTVVDLEIGRFQLANGLLTLDSRRQPLNLQGNNLRAQLDWNTVTHGYQGTVSVEPFYAFAGRNTPVSARITLPVALQRDRIEFRNARISTPASDIFITGSIENFRDPVATAHVNGHIANVDLKNAGNLPIRLDARDTPSGLDFDATATVGSSLIQVSALRINLGKSHAEASGTLRDARGSGELTFGAQFAVGELARLCGKPVNPDGIVAVNGNAAMDASSLRVNNLHVAAFDAEFDGNASFEEFARYKLSGSLRALDIQTALRTINRRVPWSGVISGTINASGDTKIAGTKSVMAEARMNIAPASRGIPVSGRLNVNYDGRADDVRIDNSFVSLPKTRLTLDGTLDRRLNIALTSHDLGDLLAAFPANDAPPVALNGGALTVSATVIGSLSAPSIDGHVAVDRFSVEGRRFDSLSTDLSVSGSRAQIRNGNLTRNVTNAQTMQIQFAGATSLQNWRPAPRSPLSADVTVQNADLADVLALAGQPPAGYSGPLSATAHIGGTMGNPQGAATVDLNSGTIAGEPFDQARAQVNLADQLVTIPTAYIQSGAGRANLRAEYRHARESFANGTIHARLQTNPMDLGALHAVQKDQPGTSGSLQLTADVTATTTADQILATSINAGISTRALRLKGQNYGDLTAAARTTNQTVAFNVNSNFAGANIRVNGTTRLVRDYPTDAEASIANLPVERALAVANRTDIPVRGLLSASVRLNGTARNPQGSGDFDLTRAVIYDEPIDRALIGVSYRADSVEIPRLEIFSGPSRINLTARYDHPAGVLDRGSAQFSLNTSDINLNRIRNVQRMRPGLGGTLEINASGQSAVRPGTPRIFISNLSAHVAATGITSQGKSFGNLTLNANTTNADQLTFALDSNLADATIHGSGDARLSGDYPVSANLTFNNLLYTHIAALMGTASAAAPGFEGATDGQVTVDGPLLKTDQLRAALQLTRLNLTGQPIPGGKSIAIANQGPIAITLEAGTVHIQSAVLTGPRTNIEAAGTASRAALNLTVNADTDLGVANDFDRDIDSSGRLVLGASVRGTMSKPLINGQLALRNASLNYRGIGNGLSNANGVIAFNGNTARVQNLTAESGGGKITVAGFVGFEDIVRFGLRANGSNVRVRTEEGASVVASADIRLSGTADSSVAAGSVSITQLTYNPQSDLGSILSRAAPPVQAPSTPSPVLEKMKLDVRVRTAPGLSVQASLARNVRADVDLQVRGTAATPGVTGRVTINEGQLVFFGSTYTVDQGSVSFYNPLRIEPVLDLTLETKAKTVSVVLHVTGPIDNMNLSYTSDPPLQFQEIVSLLASGKTPTSDATLLANEPLAPAPSVQQMGESAIISKAIADPVSSRLERVFGVTQFKIDPSFSSGTEVPTARLTIQQQISSNLTFTYTSALDDPNGQIVTIEWAFSPRWAAIANRDQNGIFSINFLYKRQFR